MHNFESILLCKFKISLIMCRHRHYHSCSIVSKHIISNINRNFLIIKRIDSISPSKNSGLFFLKFCPFELSLIFRLFLIGFYGFFLLWSGNLFNQKMLWSHHNKTHSKNSINSCCINLEDIIRILKPHLKLSSFRLTNPVPLKFLHRLIPIKSI